MGVAVYGRRGLIRCRRRVNQLQNGIRPEKHSDPSSGDGQPEKPNSVPAFFGRLLQMFA